ncbi:sensor histidine kinase [Actomonas aquatica]|uniref:CHASE4 domain-containing protein n=1 Tax=Actomonas aquatica TaxID=2866162 RepID=A0ABZ1C734_9BACT|nr:CHASE4 domain-containing protein [Opitutus sp. WL0086]WRQ87068.1 CHASE4 domain-containing protein [Opitutus sp. WL0086]
MNLITRLTLILTVVFAGIAIAVGLSYRSTKQKIELLIADRTQEHASYFRSAAKLQSAGLKSLVASYSWWDDMVAFVAEPDPKWASSNIDNIVGMPGGCDALWVLNDRFELLHTIDVDYRHPPLPFTSASLLAEHIDSNYEFSFYTNLGGQVWQIFGAAIQDPQFWRHETPTVGYMLIGKRWDEAWLVQLGDLSQTRLSLMLNPDGVPEFEPQTTRARANHDFSFTSVINGIGDTPIATVHGRFDATALEQMRGSLGEQALIFASSIAILVALLAIFIGFTVVRPLGRITRSLESRNPIHLADLLVAKSDFGEVARLLSSQFRQGRMLQEEIRRRIASADGDDDEAERESNEALRLRLASNLHDGPLQSLYAAGLKISSMEAATTAGRPSTTSQLAAIRTILTECTADLRNLLLDLEPEELRDQDLESSLQRFERYMQSISRQSAQLSIEEGVLDGLSRDAQLHIYYITRELISNAARHARPEHTSLFLRREAGFLVMRWENDGFAPHESLKSGNGLRNIGQRIQQLEGTWTYRIHRGRTWQVSIELPFTALFGAMNVTAVAELEAARRNSRSPFPTPDS